MPSISKKRSRSSAGKPIAGYDVRLIAATFYDQILYEGATLDRLFDPHYGHQDFLALPAKDRALVRAILMVALRENKGLTIVLEQFLQKPLAKKARFAHSILIISLAQILFMKTSDHAVVHVAVECAQRHHAIRGLKGLINAVLRRAVKERHDLLQEYKQSSFLPLWLKERWLSFYGARKVGSLEKALMVAPYLDLHVKSDAQHWAKVFEGHVLAPHCVRTDKHFNLSAMESYNEGAWWVQDFAATLPVFLFRNVKGLKIADLCAAPGGKTAQLAHLGAQTHAFDLSAERVERLKDNMKRLKLDVAVHHQDVLTLKDVSVYDGVLLDAPCSATGTLRRHPDIVFHRHEQDIQSRVHLQKELLAKAFTLLKPGGTLIYAVCSLEPEEGEAQVEAFLEDFPLMRLDPIEESEADIFKFLIRKGSLRSLPSNAPCGLALPSQQLFGMDGFFAARMIKATS